MPPDGQAVDETLTPINIDNKPKPAEVNDEVANNQAMKDPIMRTTFSSHPSIKTFNPKDINPNLNESEDGKDINDEDWEGLENDDDDGTTQDRNDQAQQAEPNSLSSSFFLFSSILFSFFSSPLFSYLKTPQHVWTESPAVISGEESVLTACFFIFVSALRLFPCTALAVLLSGLPKLIRWIMWVFPPLSASSDKF